MTTPTPSLREAATLALDALICVGGEGICEVAHHKKIDRHHSSEKCPVQLRVDLAIEALAAALAAPEAEPVAQWHEKADRLKKCVDYAVSGQEIMVARLRLSQHLQTEPQPHCGHAQPATAWRIEYINADGNKRRRLFGHNAVADYRAIDPGATSTPLFDGSTC